MAEKQEFNSWVFFKIAIKFNNKNLCCNFILFNSPIENNICCREMGNKLSEFKTRDNFVEVTLTFGGFGQHLSLMLHRNFMTILCTSSLLREF